MNKILNYVSKGRGIGAWPLFMLAVAVALYTSFMMNTVARQVIPYFQDKIAEIAPIEVVDGKVIVPENEVKVFDLLDYNLLFDTQDTLSEEENTPILPFVIDTTTDTLDISMLDFGIYLTRSNIYFISPTEKKVRPLNGNFELDPEEDYQPLMHRITSWSVAVIFVLVLILGFIEYLILNLFYSFITQIAEYVNHKRLQFKEKMRLNAVLFCGVYLLVFIVEFFGFQPGRIAFLLIMIILQILVIKNYPQSE